MMVDVHLVDGRTVLRFAGRRSMVELIRRDPETQDLTSIHGWIERGQGEGYHPIKMQLLRKGQIGWVEAIAVPVRDAFLLENDPDQLAFIRGKEAESRATAAEAAAA